MSLDTRTLIERHLGDASDAHYTVLMCPAPTQTAVAAALALYATLRDMLSVQPDVLPTKVTWWHEELARLRASNPVHPIVASLLPASNDAVCDALDDLLHGAVMDANRVEVTDDSLDDYLRLRCGALHTLLGHLLQTDGNDRALVAAARVQGIADLVSESRDPRFAERPNVALLLDDAEDESSVLSALTQRYDEAARALSEAPPLNVASAVWLALLRSRWSAILATQPGNVVPDARPWRKLLLAWRAARRAARPGL